jgi:hypothetical protein
MDEPVVLFGVWLCLGIIAGMLAAAKNRNPWVWALGGLMLAIVVIPYLLLTPRSRGRWDANEGSEEYEWSEEDDLLPGELDEDDELAAETEDEEDWADDEPRLDRLVLPLAVIYCIAAAMAGVGSLGTWVKLGPFSAAGREYTDGVVMLGVATLTGLLAGIWFFYPRDLFLLVAFIGFAIVAAIGIYDWIEIEDLVLEDSQAIFGQPRPAWGLIVTCFAAVAAILATVIVAYEQWDDWKDRQ